ncbi:Y-family DNA polymerase [Wenyingzhuangia marina]|uniref:DNA polymerase V n=1 Tax=Wenyingzhuangia marina TaxID=1195760 RepID=A0A1M5X0A8_9FLAO|nr:Y-family DNA polymerase [Wenyingzhuangia marina]GGF82676.1 SOS mutagenesis and repair protein UmuC [Wenyingzhuangia marina]SHH93221.1 DNA polymerase V [Wenyingzhuangia marina]
MYGIVDCNSFYASCERAFRPNLIGKPIVVLSNNDGCVIARSKEAKPYVKMGAVAFKSKEDFRKNGIHVFSSNYALYGDMSYRVMTIISKYVDDIEPYSIDEAFFKLENVTSQEAELIGKQIQKEVMQQLGLPVSVGIAASKALAKLANNIVKTYPEQTKNVYVIGTEEQRLKALKWTNIDNVWGIGRKLTKKLQEMNIKKAYDFTLLSDELVRRKFSVVGLRLKHDLEGKPTIGFEEVHDKYMIATTRSFPNVLSDLNEIEERVATFANSCAEKLRKQKSECSGAYVFLRSNRFGKEYMKIGAMVHFGFATSSSITITKGVLEKLREIFKEGYTYKKAGVILVSISPNNSHQIRLFGDENPKHQLLMQAMDKLNNKMGQGKLKLANQDIKKTWKMRQEHLSPQYTTKFSDIITVNCK